MKKLLSILALCAFALTLTLTSCTENQRAKQWGGDADLTLPQGHKLVVVTWKNDEIWYLTKPMSSTDSAETYTFVEESSWGVLEGTYTFTEQR